MLVCVAGQMQHTMDHKVTQLRAKCHLCTPSIVTGAIHTEIELCLEHRLCAIDLEGQDVGVIVMGKR